MIWIYRLLFFPGILLSIPYFLWHMKRRGGYGQDMTHRFGNLPELKKKTANRKRIWIQAVSVGELKALRPLLVSLAENPGNEIILTTTTSTGYRIARESYSDLAKMISYFPLDFVLISRKAWKIIQPDLCILMEGELWPEHIYQAKLGKIPVVLINARISDKSYRRYRSLGTPARRLFRSLTAIIASSESNANRFRELGCDPGRVSCSGNLKCDVPIPALLTHTERNALRFELGLPAEEADSSSTVVLCGASTWPGEEWMLFRICHRLRQEGIDLRLLITPRHMERRNEVRTGIKDFSLTNHFRSSGKAPGEIEVCIADTTGELTKFLQLSDIVFVGRSMPPHKGGQTPIEAGMLKKPILFGPGMSNFRELAESLIEWGVAEQVSNEQSLENAIRELCLQSDLRSKSGKAAENWLLQNQGATERTLKVLNEFLA